MNIREKIKQLVRQIGGIRDSAELDKRELTIAECEEMDSMLDEISGLEEMASRQKPPSPLTVPMSGSLENPIYRNLTNNQKRGETHIMNNSKGEYKSFGSFLADVRSAGSPGGQTNPKLFKISESRAASGLSESVPHEGGFLVQGDFAETLLDRAFETGLLAKLCRQMPISTGNSLKIPAIDETARTGGNRWGGILSYWADEATEKTASKPRFRQLELHLHKLIGLCYATDELLEDAAALGQYIEMGFAEEFGFRMDDSIINGTGAGQPLGIMNCGSLVSVAKTSGQTDYTISFENIVAMWGRLIAGARKNAVWLVNQDSEPQLSQLTIGGTAATPVYMPAGGASVSPYATLYGRPVLPIEQCQTLGTSGDIILAAFDPGYIFTQKGQLKSDVSIHTRFNFDESVFRFVLRFSGQPALNKAITPYKGSNTLSHFVKLDERKP